MSSERRGTLKSMKGPRWKVIRIDSQNQAHNSDSICSLGVLELISTVIIVLPYKPHNNVSVYIPELHRVKVDTECTVLRAVTCAVRCFSDCGLSDNCSGQKAWWLCHRYFSALQSDGEDDESLPRSAFQVFLSQAPVDNGASGTEETEQDGAWVQERGTQTCSPPPPFQLQYEKRKQKKRRRNEKHGRHRHSESAELEEMCSLENSASSQLLQSRDHVVPLLDEQAPESHALRSYTYSLLSNFHPPTLGIECTIWDEVLVTCQLTLSPTEMLWIRHPPIPILIFHLISSIAHKECTSVSTEPFVFLSYFEAKYRLAGPHRKQQKREGMGVQEKSPPRQEEWAALVWGADKPKRDNKGPGGGAGPSPPQTEACGSPPPPSLEPANSFGAQRVGPAGELTVFQGAVPALQTHTDAVSKEESWEIPSFKATFQPKHLVPGNSSHLHCSVSSTFYPKVQYERTAAARNCGKVCRDCRARRRGSNLSRNTPQTPAKPCNQITV
ncbi:hypothetical protein MJG53_016766 [Ovis ammon polii x Ovis aries]|uniref:Uncharacterized protein n=1 Tax=Ovis ammon polii x Ovis aries TaxID=2918886 RepID=A0ACB9U9I5_9CETA|nr:hypothetical protein MJG53_016766 [Ovis ammon polii x Ovis aries]